MIEAVTGLQQTNSLGENIFYKKGRMEYGAFCQSQQWK